MISTCTLRSRLKQRVRRETLKGFVEHGQIKPATVHQEFRVLRRMLKVAVRKKLLSANPCWGVEFPVRLNGLFRPHYVTWSERQQIEFHAPVYLANAVRIITETGLRVYKELTPMRKDQIDLASKIVWIPDSETANGVAQVPLTDEAVQAFESQMRAPGGTVAVPEQQQPGRPSEGVQDGLACDLASCLHIPSDGDHHSEVMAIAIPSDGDHHSEVMAITIPTGSRSLFDAVSEW